MKSNFVQYYVEGEDEEKLINILKTDLETIRPGKVQKLNVVEREFTQARLIALRPRTMVVLVFDTDTGHVNILNKNLEKLKRCSAVSEIVTIPQVLNLEDELVRSCSIKGIVELLDSKTKEEFKSDLIRVTNLAAKLREHQFDIDQFWGKRPNSPYQHVENMSYKVKLSTQ
ncbi:MAG: hypothetical protein K2O18_07190 [Oscillospiraceae bacterium]|nr:hypothetical protein [Oscillospiraceae bacterium]